MEGRGAAGVKKVRLDKRIYEDETIQSLRTKLRNEGEHGGEHPSFERDLATPQSTRCSIRKAEWCAALELVGTEQSDTKEIDTSCN